MHRYRSTEGIGQPEIARPTVDLIARGLECGSAAGARACDALGYHGRGTCHHLAAGRGAHTVQGCPWAKTNTGSTVGAVLDIVMQRERRFRMRQSKRVIAARTNAYAAPVATVGDDARTRRRRCRERLRQRSLADLVHGEKDTFAFARVGVGQVGPSTRRQPEHLTPCEGKPAQGMHRATSASGARCGHETTAMRHQQCKQVSGIPHVRLHFLGARTAVGAHMHPYAGAGQHQVVGPGEFCCAHRELADEFGGNAALRIGVLRAHQLNRGLPFTEDPADDV